jgi:hypothetical protein
MGHASENVGDACDRFVGENGAGKRMACGGVGVDFRVRSLTLRSRRLGYGEVRGCRLPEIRWITGYSCRLG